MSRITKILPSMDGVAANSTAVQKLPIGPTYDQIVIDYSASGALTRANIQNIEVEINGKTIQKFADGDQLQALNDFYGRPDNTGFLTLYFARPEMTELAHERATALGTADVQTANIKMDIATATTPSITCTAIQSEAAPLGLITKVKEYLVTAAGAGQIEIDEIVRGPRVMAIHFFKTDVSNVVIEADSRRVFEGAKATLEIIQGNAGRVPVTATCTHVDFLLEGDHAQAMLSDKKSITDLRYLPTVGSAGQIRIVTEYLDAFAGI